ncbi:MAG: hypothetical protein M0Z85_07620 [Gammaproteobacteria bacterium]|nr:hypothetical protein [Gammaproteobacteria bacterium]
MTQNTEAAPPPRSLVLYGDTCSLDTEEGYHPDYVRIVVTEKDIAEQNRNRPLDGP